MHRRRVWFQQPSEDIGPNPGLNWLPRYYVRYQEQTLYFEEEDLNRALRADRLLDRNDSGKEERTQ